MENKDIVYITQQAFDSDWIICGSSKMDIAFDSIVDFMPQVNNKYGISILKFQNGECIGGTIITKYGKLHDTGGFTNEERDYLVKVSEKVKALELGVERYEIICWYNLF